MSVSGPVSGPDPLRHMLRAIAATLLPGDAHWPSAGELELVDHIESIATLVDGHTASLGECCAALPAGFESMSDIARVDALAALQRDRPELFGVARLVMYDAYYRHPTVLSVIEHRCGFPARPPQPDGFVRAEFAPAVLDTVRAMGPRWRGDLVVRQPEES